MQDKKEPALPTFSPDPSTLRSSLRPRPLCPPSLGREAPCSSQEKTLQRLCTACGPGPRPRGCNTFWEVGALPVRPLDGGQLVLVGRGTKKTTTHLCGRVGSYLKKKVFLSVLTVFCGFMWKMMFLYLTMTLNAFSRTIQRSFVKGAQDGVTQEINQTTTQDKKKTLCCGLVVAAL